jgi:hypothetical protein
VQLAARLCSRADPGGILVAGAVHDLALGKGFAFHSRGKLRLKGFDSPMAAFERVADEWILIITRHQTSPAGANMRPFGSSRASKRSQIRDSWVIWAGVNASTT